MRVCQFELLWEDNLRHSGPLAFRMSSSGGGGGRGPWLQDSRLSFLDVGSFYFGPCCALAGLLIKGFLQDLHGVYTQISCKCLLSFCSFREVDGV